MFLLLRTLNSAPRTPNRQEAKKQREVAEERDRASREAEEAVSDEMMLLGVF